MNYQVMLLHVCAVYDEVYYHFIVFPFLMILPNSCEGRKLSNTYLFTVMGKAEGHGENWHGHVTALTVSPEFRRLGLAATLMAWLEDVSEK
jgi:ribosomal protein S18 acetylase RimI-like enzyme